MINNEIYFTDEKSGKRRDIVFAAEFTPAFQANADEIVRRANIVIAAYEAATGDTVEHCNSGWRPKSINDATPKASKTSKHLTCEAVDLRDLGNVLDTWLDTEEGQAAMEEANVWREHPSATNTWCHLQTAPYHSWEQGKTRTFMP